MPIHTIPGQVCLVCGGPLRMCYDPHYGNPERPAGELPHLIHNVGGLDHDAHPGPTELYELLADDASTFPGGHPCRDCDQLYKDHPHSKCEGWR